MVARRSVQINPRTIQCAISASTELKNGRTQCEPFHPISHSFAPRNSHAGSDNYVTPTSITFPLTGVAMFGFKSKITMDTGKSTSYFRSVWTDDMVWHEPPNVASYTVFLNELHLYPFLREFATGPLTRTPAARKKGRFTLQYK
jgi:hypothetical protein